jgi:hypothetical protein
MFIVQITSMKGCPRIRTSRQRPPDTSKMTNPHMTVHSLSGEKASVWWLWTTKRFSFKRKKEF